jgi:hypothetical protein
MAVGAACPEAVKRRPAGGRNLDGGLRTTVDSRLFHTPPRRIAAAAHHGDPSTMKSFATRLSASAVLAVLGWLVLAGATAPRAPAQPDKLIILSTTDVKGEIKPCG